MKDIWTLKNITFNETKNKKYEVAIIPIGATEPHNYHLPYGSDIFHSEYVASESCRVASENGASVIQLPTIPYGVDANLLDFPLAINVYQKTLNLFVKDIIDSLIFHNIMKIVILNGHGGNDFKPFLRDLYPNCKAFVCYIDWWRVGMDKYKEIFEFPDDHSGEMETSVNLLLKPDLVHLENADDGIGKPTQFDAINKGWVSISRRWCNHTASSGSGFPLKATKEKGEQYLKIAVERISDYLLNLSKTPFSDKFPY